MPLYPQDLRPLQWVLQWRGLLSPFHLHSLLEGEFFPKWMHVLYAWLAAPGADFSEVRALLAHHLCGGNLGLLRGAWERYAPLCLGPVLRDGGVSIPFLHDESKFEMSSMAVPLLATLMR